MVTLTFPRGTMQPSQLLDELLVANPAWRGWDRGDGVCVEPQITLRFTASEVQITVPEGTEGLVQTVVANHLPGPSSSARDRARRLSLRARLKDKLQLTDEELDLLMGRT